MNQLCMCGSSAGYPHYSHCPFPFYGHDEKTLERWDRESEALRAPRLAVGSVVGELTVHQVFNGVALHFTRRRYGRVVFTWLDYWNGEKWVSAGDPWKGGAVPQKDLARIFGAGVPS